MDLGCYGKLFTWFNSRSCVATAFERLDRVVANQLWVNLFQEGSVEKFATRTVCSWPILLTTDVWNRAGKSSPSRFEVKGYHMVVL